MRRSHLGKFEEVILLMVATLNGTGYGVTISQAMEEHAGRVVPFGMVHNTLIRLKEKGFVSSKLGERQPSGVVAASACFRYRRWTAGH